MVLRGAGGVHASRAPRHTREAQEGRGKGRVARCVRGRRDGGPLVVISPLYLPYISPISPLYLPADHWSLALKCTYVR